MTKPYQQQINPNKGKILAINSKKLIFINLKANLSKIRAEEQHL
ncbi:hypothetical protein [Serratia sp. NA_13]